MKRILFPIIAVLILVASSLACDASNPGAQELNPLDPVEDTLTECPDLEQGGGWTPLCEEKVKKLPTGGWVEWAATEGAVRLAYRHNEIVLAVIPQTRYYKAGFLREEIGLDRQVKVYADEEGLIHVAINMD